MKGIPEGLIVETEALTYQKDSAKAAAETTTKIQKGEGGPGDPPTSGVAHGLLHCCSRPLIDGYDPECRGSCWRCDEPDFAAAAG